MSDERKATEILLAIENDVKQTLAYVRNLDLNHRLILERLRILTTGAAQPPPLAVSPKPIQVEVDEFPPVPPQPLTPSPFQTASNMREKLRKAMAEAKADEEASVDREAADQIDVEKTQSGPRRGTRVQTNASKQISVSQRIIGKDEKNVFMAKVELFDQDENLVKQTKTNQTGKWLAQLVPGTYTVMVNKAGAANKPGIDVKYTINIPGDNTSFELDPKKV